MGAAVTVFFLLLLTLIVLGIIAYRREERQTRTTRERLARCIQLAVTRELDSEAPPPPAEIEEEVTLTGIRPAVLPLLNRYQRS